MPSPFPGMDPFLEEPALWPDVHHGLISEFQAALNQALRPRYHVRVEERVYVSDDEDPGRDVIIPDLRVSGRRVGRQSTGASPEGRASTKRIEMTTLVEDEIHEARLNIIDSTDHSTVTIIEILSPSNKVPGSRGRASFQQKRREIMNSAVHWVEIDLLRAGRRFIRTRKLPPHEYLFHVSRVESRPRGSVWPISIRDVLPVVEIPLRHGDADATLDVQAALNAAYDRAGYDMVVDYRSSPVPPLTEEASSWADSLLKEKGLR